MSKLKIHAGDFEPGNSAFQFGSLFLKTATDRQVGEHIPLDKLERVEIASEEAVKKLGGSLLWAGVGAVALGPIGALAGALAGGNTTVVTFAAKLKDGRKFVATTDTKTFAALKAAVL